jgi:hypothetical protein
MPDSSPGPDRGLATRGFVMHGARAAIASGLVHITQQVEAIERAVDENPGLAFDLAKTLIEEPVRQTPPSVREMRWMDVY